MLCLGDTENHHLNWSPNCLHAWVCSPLPDQRFHCKSSTIVDSPEYTHQTFEIGPEKSRMQITLGLQNLMFGAHFQYASKLTKNIVVFNSTDFLLQILSDTMLLWNFAIPQKSCAPTNLQSQPRRGAPLCEGCGADKTGGGSRGSTAVPWKA